MIRCSFRSTSNNTQYSKAAPTTMVPLLVVGRRIAAPCGSTRPTYRAISTRLSQRRRESETIIRLHNYGRHWRTQHHQHHQARPLRQHRGLLSVAVPMVDAAISSFLARWAYREQDDQREKYSTMLASSPFAVELPPPRFLRLTIEWFKRLLKRYWDYILVVIRGTEITMILSPMLLLAPASVVADRLFRTSAVSDISWGYLVGAVQFLGPAFVKLCQWAATRRDIFPPHVCDRLSKLHADGLPHQWAYTHEMLTESFGDYESKGLHIEPNDIIGCGSAAQVYAATLAVRGEDGEEKTKHVAVKVLHPHFEYMVDRDIWFMQGIADMIQSIPLEIVKVMNLSGATTTFGSVLRRQADLHIEATNLEQFRKNFYKSKDDLTSSAVFFPGPMKGWVSNTVLVEDLVNDAVPISVYLRDDSKDGRAIRKELASPLLRAFLKMVFLDNFVHCDIHPGNVLVRTTMIKKPDTVFDWLFRNIFVGNEFDFEREEVEKRTLVFLDAGIATALGENDRKNLFDLFRAVITNKGKEAGMLMIERAKHERCSQEEGGVEAFTNGIAAIVSEFHDRRKEGLTLGAVRIGSLLSRVLDLCRVHGVEVDPAMANVVISTLVLEGLGRSLEPRLNLIDFALPFIMGRGRV